MWEIVGHGPQTTKMDIRYGCQTGNIVWISSLGVENTTVNQQAKLNRIQRTACLAISGAISTTPTAALEVLLDMPPLHIHIQKEAARTAYRLKQMSICMPQDIILEATSGSEVIRTQEVLGMISDIMPTTINTSLPFETISPDREDWAQKEAELLAADIGCFTDGSRTEQGTGIGIYGRNPHVRTSASLGKYTTIFQAEVYAIDLCAQLLHQKQYRRKTIKIFTDSQAAVKAIASHRCKSKTVWCCQASLNELAKNNQVAIVWIPGHSNMEGNERADSLAKEGANKAFLGPEPAIGISSNTAKLAINAWAESEGRRYWHQTPELAHSKKFIRDTSKSRAQKLLELNRAQLKTLVGLYTGHCRLNHHMHKIGRVDNGTCRLCQEDDESAEHIWCNCPAADRTRFSIGGKAHFAPEDLDKLAPMQALSYIKRLNLLGEI